MQRISLITTLFLSFASCAGASEGPLLINESFEQSSTLPSDWQFEHWLPDVSAVEIQSQTAADGKHSLHLSSTQANHAYVKKTIAVQANQTYLFQAKIKAIGADSTQLGALIGVDGQADASEDVANDGEWHARQVYIHTGDTTSITILLGLGHFSNLNLGNAWFDEVIVQAVNQAPLGAKVIQLPQANLASNLARHELDLATPKMLLFFSSLLLLSISWLILAWRRQAKVESVPTEMMQ